MDSLYRHLGALPPYYLGRRQVYEGPGSLVRRRAIDSSPVENTPNLTSNLALKGVTGGGFHITHVGDVGLGKCMRGNILADLVQRAGGVDRNARSVFPLAQAGCLATLRETASTFHRVARNIGNSNS